MRRKVIKIGPATLVISLPADWAKKYNITKGDELEIIELGRSLKIQTKKETSQNSTTIEISKYNPLIMRTLGMLYKVGYSEIKIYYDEKKKNYRTKEYSEIDLLKRAIESYSGMDLEEIRKDKDGNYLLITERTNLLPSEFKKTLDQAFRHLCYISEQVTVSIDENNKESLKNIIMTDNLINQTTNFCQKVLNKSGYEDSTKTSLVYLIVVGIEKLGDKYCQLYEYFSRNKIKVNKEIVKISLEIDETINELYSLYRKFDSEKLTSIGDKVLKLLNEIDIKIEKCSNKEIKILFYLGNILDEIYDLLEPMMGYNHESLK